jgi:hypothetical protein
MGRGIQIRDFGHRLEDRLSKSQINVYQLVARSYCKFGRDK